MANLILVHQPAKQDRSDYQAIARRIAEAQAGIRVFIVDTKAPGMDDGRFDAASPTLTVSPMPIKRFAPPRGTVCQGYEYPKGEQYLRLQRLGVPVPRWARLEADSAFDPREWGPYVVVKPELGRKGAEVVIKKTGRVRYRPPESYPEDHPARKAPMLVQRFVYTGRWPANYRVVTLFGEPLLCWRCEASREYRPLESRWDFKALGGMSIVSNKRDSRYALAFDADVLALAREAHRAFPEQPLLGTDLVRDADTGELSVIECNPRGDAWLVSSDMGRLIERANGLDFAAQFGALEIASRVLARETHLRAS